MQVSSDRVFISMTISPKKGFFGDDWWNAIVERVRVEFNDDNGLKAILSKEHGSGEEFTHIQASLLLLKVNERKFRENIKTLCRGLPGCDMTAARGHKNHTYRFRDQSGFIHNFGYPLKEYEDLEDENIVVFGEVGDREELKSLVDTSFKEAKAARVKTSLDIRMRDLFVQLVEEGFFTADNVLQNNKQIKYDNSGPAVGCIEWTSVFKSSQFRSYMFERKRANDFNFLKRNPELAEFYYNELFKFFHRRPSVYNDGENNFM